MSVLKDCGAVPFVMLNVPQLVMRYVTYHICPKCKYHSISSKLSQSCLTLVTTLATLYLEQHVTLMIKKDPQEGPLEPVQVLWPSVVPWSPLAVILVGAYVYLHCIVGSVASNQPVKESGACI